MDLPVDAEGLLLKTPLPPDSVKLDCRDETGATPLILATLKGHLLAAKVLLSYMANPDTRDTHG